MKKIQTQIYMLFLFIFVILPLLLIIKESFVDLNGQFTIKNYFSYFQPVYIKMTFNSFLYAFLITLSCLIFGYLTAYCLMHLKHKKLFLMLFILPTWINLLLKAYAFIGLLGKDGLLYLLAEKLLQKPTQLLFTDFSFILVSTYIFIPFMVLPIYNSLNKISPNIIDAANDLGASKLTILRKILIPLTYSGIKSGIQIVFIPSLSLFVLTKLIAGSRVITLGTAVEEHFLVTQNWGLGSTIAVVLIIIMLFLMIILRSRGKAYEE